MSVIAQKLESLVGSNGVCAWENLTPALQFQISQAVVPATQIDCVVYPSTSAELAEVITCTHLNRWPVLLRGSGSKLHWGGLAEGVKVVISSDRLNRLIDHAIGDLTVTAEAGLRLSDLQATLAKAGQFLAIDPAYADSATLGGIVATADTGSLRQRYGGVRDMLIGLSFIRTDGKIAKAGGRVVKNVAGYDLMKLFTGSYGTLGMISQVTFRIYPLPLSSRTVVLMGEAEAAAALSTEIAQAAAALLASALTPTAIEILSSQTASALEMGKGMALVSRFQNISVSVEKQAAQLLQLGQTLGLKSVCLAEADEADLWQRLRAQIDAEPNEPTVTCKIGVAPSKAAETLAKIEIAASNPIGCIHAGSGLGTLRFNASSLSSPTLLEIRQLLQAQGGFMTVLEAPSMLKQQIEVWGYSGNAIELMKKIKRQFDPENLFSPHRFVGGI